MPAELTIRPATPADAATLARFNCAMAWETERRRLAEPRVQDGVKALLAQPEYGFYLVAEQQGQVVGSLLVTSEWSDWHNGLYWWIQSVYVEPEWRAQGVFSALYRQCRQRARAHGGVYALRLYVERDNARAQRVYQALGMRETAYRVYEQPVSA